MHSRKQRCIKHKLKAQVENNQLDQRAERRDGATSCRQTAAELWRREEGAGPELLEEETPRVTSDSTLI